jgi:phytoene synthase
LYSFVRVVDDCVDVIPQQKDRFETLRQAWLTAEAAPYFKTLPQPGDTTDERIIKNIVYLSRKYNFDRAWIGAFFDSMQADFDDKTYQTLEDTLGYVYGSAEVIGLMMSSLLGLDPRAYEAARMQGRAMQYINFIRDIAEDAALGRCYFPADELKAYELDLSKEIPAANKAAFGDFMHDQLQRYDQWQTAARQGYGYLPRHLRAPIETAAEMYDWTARQIGSEPFVVFRRQVKPTKRRLVISGLINVFS